VGARTTISTLSPVFNLKTFGAELGANGAPPYSKKISGADGAGVVVPTKPESGMLMLGSGVPGPIATAVTCTLTTGPQANVIRHKLKSAK
jgi:hypothetical protein